MGNAFFCVRYEFLAAVINSETFWRTFSCANISDFPELNPIKAQRLLARSSHRATYRQRAALANPQCSDFCHCASAKNGHCFALA
jgi:hypothetical protein